MSTPKKRERIVTPAGKAVLLFVTKPSTKFKEEGEYTAKVVLDGKSGEALFAKFTELAKATKASDSTASKYKLHVPIEKETDEEGTETGNWILKSSNTATYKDKQGKVQNRSIQIVDSKGNPLPPSIKLGRGSVVQIGATINPYIVKGTKTVGVSLWLEAVRVLNLVEYQGKGFDWGDTPEGAYVAEDQSTDSEESGDESGGDEDAGNDATSF